METEGPDGETTERSATLALTATTLKLEEQHVSSDLDDSFLRRLAGADDDARPELTPPPLGSIVDGKYRLESLRGRGGMGFVFGARHLASDRPVALKWMQRRGDVGELSKRFIGEARAAGRIRHPNVVDVYDVVATKDLTYLVMELLEGESLRRRLRRGPLDHTEAVELGVGLLSGLEEAHRRGVIHRDLKPENVFLCSDPPGRIKIVDFGISVVESVDLASPLTRAGQFVGTPSYTALERLRDHQMFDHRVDLYSVGVILYEALSGNLPFSAMSVSELTFQLATSDATPLGRYLPTAPSSLQRVIHKALARDAADRFPDARSFREALVATLGTEVVRPATRYRGRIAVAVAAAGLALALVAWTRRPIERPPSHAAATSTSVPSAGVAVNPSPSAPPRPAPRAPEVPAPVTSALPFKPKRVSRPEKAAEQARPGETPVADVTIRVVVFPYGDVWVDGRRAGPSPARVNVAAGTHTVAGGRDAPVQQRRIDVHAGETREVVLSWDASASGRTSETEPPAPPDFHAPGRDGELQPSEVRAQ